MSAIGLGAVLILAGGYLEHGRHIDPVIFLISRLVEARGTVRPITIRTGVLPRTHGSALFTRGETQALVATTLGTEREAQIIDALQGERRDNFMLHYNFPPYCVGETGRVGSPKRREIGHGRLAKRGVLGVMPTEDEFPYTIRVVSEITESNGSSSMASVCGSSLAMMDAGVPLKAPVAGVAMGLIKEADQYAVLTDIMGDEDHLGDMDFKVAGTKDAVNALQMDIKIDGITREIMQAALAQAHEARMHILEQMNIAIASPREEMSAYAPRYITMKINPDKIRDIIGPGGKTIRGIQEETGCEVEIDNDGKVLIRRRLQPGDYLYPPPPHDRVIAAGDQNTEVASLPPAAKPVRAGPMSARVTAGSSRIVRHSGEQNRSFISDSRDR